MMNQGETSPPSLLTEADLISLMEKHGIGTDATHAEHIETIKTRLYVGVRPDGKFVPGELGMGLVEGYDAMGYEMSKPFLRAQLESDLKKICDGEKDKNVVLAEQIAKYKMVFVEACRQATKIDEALIQFFGDAKQLTTDGNNGRNASDVQSPVCQCGDDARLMTVKKDGPNTGRQFYTCPHSTDSRCSFFLWADSIDNDTTDTTPNRQLATSTRSNHQDRMVDNIHQCHCGASLKLLTVGKEGSNKGRQFYSCRKSKAQGGCGFFVWADGESGLTLGDTCHTRKTCPANNN